MVIDRWAVNYLSTYVIEEHYIIENRSVKKIIFHVLETVIMVFLKESCDISEVEIDIERESEKVLENTMLNYV